MQWLNIPCKLSIVTHISQNVVSEYSGRSADVSMKPTTFWVVLLIGITQTEIEKKLLKQNWFQFLFVLQATALKQQISKFYPQILGTEASCRIYTSQWSVTLM